MDARPAAEPVGRSLALHPEILPDVQARVLKLVGPWSAKRGFYLAGGTAVALRFGHRRSIDFDFFGEDAIAAPRRFVKELAAVVAEPMTELQVSRGTVYLELWGVTMSWFRYRYSLLRPASSWRGSLVASLEDLSAMKLSAIYDRGSRKDFVDVFALLESGSDLGALVELFRAKYPGANVAHLKRLLTYFERADREPSPTMLRRAPWPQVKRRIRDAVAGLG